MYDRHLDGFIKVVECGSFSKAAEQLFISPNALIKHVNLLERDVGVKLLARSTHGVAPTPAGVFLAQRAKAIIAESLEAVDEARRIGGAEECVVRLATSPFRPLTRVASWWREVEAEHPRIRLSVVPIFDDIRSWPKVLHEIGGDVDVVVAIKPSPAWDWYEKCQVRDIYEVPLVCAVPSRHRLREKSGISLEDLHGEKVQLAHEGSTPRVDALRDHMRERHPQIEIIDCDPYDLTMLNRAAAEGIVTLVSSERKGVHSSFDYVPLEGGWTIMMSLLYAPLCGSAVSEFVDAICAQSKKHQRGES